MESAMDELKRVPAWGWIIVGLVVVGVILALRNGAKKKQTIGNLAQPQAQDLSALTSTDTTQGNAALQELLGIQQEVSKIGQTNSSFFGADPGYNVTPMSWAWRYPGGQWQFGPRPAGTEWTWLLKAGDLSTAEAAAPDFPATSGGTSTPSNMLPSNGWYTNGMWHPPVAALPL